MAEVSARSPERQSERTSSLLGEFLARDERPAITVIIPTKDRPVLVRRALKSALEQVGVDVHIVVVDDGSRVPLDTAAWGLFPNVRFLRNRRPRGVARARNMGLGLATTPFVAFLDDDDVWAPTKLGAQIDAMRGHPGARWSAIGSMTVGPGLEPLAIRMPPKNTDEVLATNPIPGGGSGVVAATSLVRQLGGFNEWLGPFADWDMWIRLAMISPLASVHEVHMGYMLHPQGMSAETGRHELELRWIERAYRVDRELTKRDLDVSSMYSYIASSHQRGGRVWHAARAQFALAVRSRRPAMIVSTMLRGIIRPGRFVPENIRRHQRSGRPTIEAPAWLIALR